MPKPKGKRAGGKGRLHLDTHAVETPELLEDGGGGAGQAHLAQLGGGGPRRAGRRRERPRGQPRDQRGQSA